MDTSASSMPPLAELRAAVKEAVIAELPGIGSRWRSELREDFSQFLEDLEARVATSMGTSRRPAESPRGPAESPRDADVATSSQPAINKNITAKLPLPMGPLVKTDSHAWAKRHLRSYSVKSWAFSDGDWSTSSVSVNKSRAVAPCVKEEDMKKVGAMENVGATAWTATADGNGASRQQPEPVNVAGSMSVPCGKGTKSTNTADTNAVVQKTSLNSAVVQAQSDLEPFKVFRQSKVHMAAAGVVNTAGFDSIVGLLIVLNAIVIGIQTDYVARHRLTDVPTEFRILEVFFCCAFSLEITARLFVQGRGFFFGNGSEWNLFDLLLTSVDVIQEVLRVLISEPDSGHVNFAFARVLRLLRAVRIVRTIRLLKFFGELRTLATSIVHSMRSLAWTVLLLMLVIYVVAIWFTQLVASQTVVTDVEFYETPNLQLYYGSLGSSVFMLFQAVTGGVDWGDAISPLSSTTSSWMSLVFSLYIAFALLCLMNTVTGVFVETAISNARTESEFFMVRAVRELFRASGNMSGAMTFEVFCSLLDEPHMLEYFKAIDVDPSEAKGVFDLLDLDHSGSLDAEDFLDGCLRLRGPAKALDLSLVMHEVRRVSKRLDSHLVHVDRLLSNNKTKPKHGHVPEDDLVLS